MVDNSCLPCHYLLCDLSIGTLSFLLGSASCRYYEPWLASTNFFFFFFSFCTFFSPQSHRFFFVASVSISWLSSRLWYLKLIDAVIICHCFDQRWERKERKRERKKERVCPPTGPEDPVSLLLIHTHTHSLSLSLSLSLPCKSQNIFIYIYIYIYICILLGIYAIFISFLLSKSLFGFNFNLN